MDKLYIIKTGGNVVDDAQSLTVFLKAFSKLDGYRILVHGGGKIATRLGEQLNIPQQMTEGRRITDAETLKVVTMVYAGLINKSIVALLQSFGCNAFGICGADGNSIYAHKRIVGSVDFGFAGDVDSVNSNLFTILLRQGLVPVVSPITHDGKGQLLNTNGDTIAQELAKALSACFSTELIYCLEKKGVLENIYDDSSVIGKLDRKLYHDLRRKGKISEGMVPKLDNAFEAVDSGVKNVHIGKAEDLAEIIQGKKGTTISES